MHSGSTGGVLAAGCAVDRAALSRRNWAGSQFMPRPPDPASNGKCCPRASRADAVAKQPADPVRVAAQEFWQLPDDELDRLLALTRQVDRVQLKHLVPECSQNATCAAFGVDFASARTRRVYYLDTTDLALDRHGVVARVRSIGHKADDSVVKLRPTAPDDLPGGLRQSRHFVLEVDGMPGSYVCSGALRTRLGAHDVERAVADERPLRTLFSEPQLALLATHAPAHVGIDDLVTLGPVDVRRCKFLPDGFDRALVVEQWTFPRGARILELSTRCTASEVLRVAASTAAVLRAHGVDLVGPQTTKTRAALDFFSGQSAMAGNR
jgi:hypothetical protein